MIDDLDTMMASGLLHTVRECARNLYGENQIYPCDDVKRMASENERLRRALDNIQHVRVLQGKAITDASKEIERLRAALVKISEYEIEEDCPCNACQHSAIARAALGDTHDPR